MTTPLKFDAGKPRLDLIPWSDVSFIADGPSMSVAYMALKSWWCAKPVRFTIPLPRSAVRSIAAVLGFGAAKYGDRNWEDGITYGRVFAAACRHAEADAAGEALDPESGLPHVAHFWCNVMFLVTYALRGFDTTELDDRPSANAELVARLSHAQQPRPESN